MNEQHEMFLESVSSIGTEHWFCPDCERRLLKLTWHPDDKVIIVEAGNEQVPHLHREEETPYSNQNAPKEEKKLTADDEIRMRPWLDWLKKVDFDDW